MTAKKTPAAQPMVPIGALADRLRTFVDKGRAAQDAAHAAIQIAYHGPGLTFGELAIGELFDWAAPIPRGPEPLVKTAADQYAWSRGTGRADAFYRVERVSIEQEG